MEHERILLELDCLRRFAAEPPGITIREIQRFLDENSNLSPVSALTVRRDLDRLVSIGNDIRVTNGAHNTAYYQLCGSGFTFNEIRFIVDSISINKFLSDSEKRRLIKKFEGFCSDRDVRSLISRVKITNRTPAADLLTNLETIHRIIAEKRRINFEYGRFDTNGRQQFNYKPRLLCAKEVVYFNERFYLICIDEETDRRRVYRIDRMRKIQPGDVTRCKTAIPKPEGAMLDIFDPERIVRVTLQVRRFLLDEMLETLGSYAQPQDDPEHPDCVIVRATVGISRNFYHWVLRYGDDIEVLSPDDIRSEIAAKIRAVSALYEKTAQ